MKNETKKIANFELENLRTFELPVGALLAIEHDENAWELAFHIGNEQLVSSKRRFALKEALKQRVYILLYNDCKPGTILQLQKSVDMAGIAAIPEVRERLADESLQFENEEKFFSLAIDLSGKIILTEFFKEKFGDVFMVYLSKEPAKITKRWLLEKTKDHPEIRIEWTYALHDENYIEEIDNEVSSSSGIPIKKDGKTYIEFFLRSEKIDELLQEMREHLAMSSFPPLLQPRPAHQEIREILAMSRLSEEEINSLLDDFDRYRRIYPNGNA